MRQRSNFTAQEIIDFQTLERQGVPYHQFSQKMAVMRIMRKLGVA